MAEIVIENLYKSFDTKDGTVEALKNVNLSIESGDIYGIIGMSGAGKSTLKLNVNYYKVILKHCKPKEKSRYRYLLKTHL